MLAVVTLFVLSPLSLLSALKDLKMSIGRFIRQGCDVFVEFFRVPKNIYYKSIKLISSYKYSEDIKAYLHGGVEGLDDWDEARERQRIIDYFDSGPWDYLMECPQCKSTVFMRSSEPENKCNNCVPNEFDENGWLTNTDDQVDMVVIREREDR